MAGAILSRSLTMGNGSAPAARARAARSCRGAAARRDVADPRAAAVVVLAAAEAARDANGPAVAVHDDDGVHPVGLARAADSPRSTRPVRSGPVACGPYDRTRHRDRCDIFSPMALGATIYNGTQEASAPSIVSCAVCNGGQRRDHRNGV